PAGVDAACVREAIRARGRLSEARPVERMGVDELRRERELDDVRGRQQLDQLRDEIVLVPEPRRLLPLERACPGADRLREGRVADDADAVLCTLVDDQACEQLAVAAHLECAPPARRYRVQPPGLFEQGVGEAGNT